MTAETSQRLRRGQRFWSDILTIRGRRLIKAIRAEEARAALVDRLRQETLRLKARTPGSWFDPISRGFHAGSPAADAGPTLGKEQDLPFGRSIGPPSTISSGT